MIEKKEKDYSFLFFFNTNIVSRREFQETTFRMFTYRFSLRTKIYEVNKRRLLLSFATKTKKKQQQKDTTRNNRVLRALHSTKKKNEIERELCVYEAHGTSCCWHKKTGSSYRLINGLIFQLDSDCRREQHRNVTHTHTYFTSFSFKKQRERKDHKK
jgi:hypothetical protein